MAIKVDLDGNIYLAGLTSGNLDGQLNAGSQDGFLTKLDSSGNLVWTRLFGSIQADVVTALDLDSAGHLWIGGYSAGEIGTHTNSGGQDAFVIKYDNAGNLLGDQLFATAGDDYIFGLAATAEGGVEVTGWTTGNLGGPNAGGRDIFVAKIVPEPASAALLLVGGALLGLRRNRKTL